jgi:hypothetical protein
MLFNKNFNESTAHLSTCKSQRSPYSLKFSFKKFPPISSSHKLRRGLSSNDLSSVSSIFNVKKVSFSKKLAEYDFPSSLIREYREFLSELPKTKANRFIQEELLSLYQNRSTALMALSSYRVWQESIRQIKRLSEEAAIDTKWKTNPATINEIISTLSDHSYCTLVLVENILSWQSSLSVYTFPEEESLKFIVEDVVVLDYLVKSCDFLMDSELTLYFSFSISDPFLLSAARSKPLDGSNTLNLGTNFYKTRDCKDLFYLDFHPEAMKKMKELSRWLFRRNFVTRGKRLQKVRKSMHHLPSIKQERSFINTLAMELVLGDMVVTVMSQVVEDFFNLKLAEKICFHFWMSETVRMLKKIVKETINHEKKEALEVERRKKEKNFLAKLIVEDFIDLCSISLLDLPESFSELFSSVQQEIQAEAEKKRLEIDSKVSLQICESFLTLEDLTSLLTSIASESETDYKAFLQELSLQNQKITSKIFENLMKAFFDLVELPEIVSEVYSIEELFFITQQKLDESSRNSKNLLLSSIFESIVRNLIETVLECLPILCEEVLNEVVEKQEKIFQDKLKTRLETDKIVQALAEDVLQCFVLDKWLFEMCRNMCFAEESTLAKESFFIDSGFHQKNVSVERAEDYAMEVFTPGIHSPNEVSLDHSFTGNILVTNQSLAEDTPRPVQEFAKILKKINKPSLQPFNEKPKNLLDALGRYRLIMQNLNEDFLFFDEELVRICELSWNSHFFWIICDKKIAGLLVFSQDIDGIVVNHSSVMNFLLFKDLIKMLPKLLESYQAPLKIRLKRKPSTLIEESLKKTGFLFTEETEDFLLYQKKITETKNFLLQVKNFTQIEIGKELIEKTRRFSIELSEFGNLFNIISLVHHILNENSSTEVEENPENKLQEDLNEILSIVLFTSYPKIQNFSIKNQNSSNSKIFTSSLNLNLNLLASTFTIHDTFYKFVKIPANRVKIRTGPEDCRMFIFGTSDPDLSIFIYDSKTLDMEIEENLRISKTDLFYYASSLLKSLEDPEKYSKDLLVPCFSKKLEFNNLLMHGYQIIAEDSYFVNDCNEKIVIDFDFAVSPNTTLTTGSKILPISSDFLFGIIESGIFEEIEIPLLVTRVRKNDWKS